MRVVLDTNVIVSALFFGGVPRKVYDLVGMGITPCFTQDTLAELTDIVTHQKFEQERSRISFPVSGIIEKLRAKGVVVEARPLTTRISPDPSDDMFLICAIISDAECIVSGDDHLLSLKNFSGIPIMTPRQFLRSVRRG